MYCAGRRVAEVRVLVEAKAHKVRRITLSGGVRNIFLLDLLKLEIDGAVRVDLGQQVPIDLGLGFLSPGRKRWQSITHGAGSADDPARQHATIRAPIVTVKNSTHVKMRMAGQSV